MQGMLIALKNYIVKIHGFIALNILVSRLLRERYNTN